MGASKERYRILAVGDMHLGRGVPLPEELVDLQPVRAAWRATVAFARSQGVDAVVLLGDVVDRDQDFFEGLPALQEGVAELVEAGIAVLGIAGNHDVAVLPRIAKRVPEFQLLGADGHWEAWPAPDFPLELWGWSFPKPSSSSSKDGSSSSPQYKRSPVAELRAPADRSRIRVGLLHADLLQSESAYAPVRREELLATGFHAWLLGHVHKPPAELRIDHDPSRPIGYLGSLVGLNAKETGPHGPWLLTFDRAGLQELVQVPLAPVRWEELSVDLTGVAAVSEVEDRLADVVQSRLAEDWLPGAKEWLRAVGLRLRFTGRTGLSPETIAAQCEAWSSRSSGVAWFVHDVVCDLRPVIELERLAERPRDLVGALARDLRGLEDGTAAAELRDAFQELVGREAPRLPQFGAQLFSDPAEQELLWREALWEAGIELLEAFLAAPEAGS